MLGRAVAFAALMVQAVIEKIRPQTLDGLPDLPPKFRFIVSGMERVIYFRLLIAGAHGQPLFR